MSKHARPVITPLSSKYAGFASVNSKTRIPKGYVWGVLHWCNSGLRLVRVVLSPQRMWSLVSVLLSKACGERCKMIQTQTSPAHLQWDATSS